MEVFALDQSPEAVDAAAFDGWPLLFRFVILEIDTDERFAGVELARFAVETDPAPIIDAVGGIGVLLDFDQHDAGIDGVNPTRRNKERISRQHLESVDVVDDGLRILDAFERAHEIGAAGAPAEPGDEMRVLIGFEHVPHFGFRFAFEFGGERGGRMNLQREPFAGVEEFDEKGKARGLRAGRRFALAAWGHAAYNGRTQELCAMGFDLLAEGFAFVGSVGNNGLHLVTVADFPGFADAFARRHGFAVMFQRISAPDAFLQNRGKFVRVKHLCALQLAAVLHTLLNRKEDLQHFSMGKDSKHSGGREIWAVVLVVLSLLLLLSLISYDPYDVGHISASDHRPAANFIGPVGAWIAFVTFQAFGLAAYGLMAVLAVIGATLLLGKEVPWRGKIGAGALLLISLSCLLHVAGLVRAQHALNLPDSAGGFLGLFVGGFFQRLVGKPGTIIIFGGCYVIGLILLINFRPSYWVALTVGTATDFWQRKRKGKSKSSVEDELRDQERELTIKEFQNDRELARGEKEARKLATERSNGGEEPARERRPEPKFEDYTVSRPQNGADKKKGAEEGAPSLVEKIADKLKPKKDGAPGASSADGSTESEAGAAAASPRPKRDKPAATVLGSVSAASGEEYLLPTIELLEQPPLPGKRDVMEDLKASARVLRETLQE